MQFDFPVVIAIDTKFIQFSHFGSVVALVVLVELVELVLLVVLVGKVVSTSRTEMGWWKHRRDIQPTLWTLVHARRIYRNCSILAVLAPQVSLTARYWKQRNKKERKPGPPVVVLARQLS